MTRSCPVRRLRPHVPWPMRVRCRFGGGYLAAHPCRRWGLRRARDPLRERLVPTVRVSLAQRPLLSGAREPLDGVNLCAQMGLSLQTSPWNPMRSWPTLADVAQVAAVLAERGTY